MVLGAPGGLGVRVYLGCCEKGEGGRAGAVRVRVGLGRTSRKLESGWKLTFRSCGRVRRRTRRRREEEGEGEGGGGGRGWT